MRPEDVVVAEADDPLAAVPVDVALEALDAELAAAGEQARRMLNGKRQPTRFFTIELRHALLEGLLADRGAATSEGADSR